MKRLKSNFAHHKKTHSQKTITIRVQSMKLSSIKLPYNNQVRWRQRWWRVRGESDMHTHTFFLMIMMFTLLDRRMYWERELDITKIISICYMTLSVSITRRRRRSQWCLSGICEWNLLFFDNQNIYRLYWLIDGVIVVWGIKKNLKKKASLRIF